MGRKSVPTGRCSICLSPDRGRIDYLVACGEPVSTVAKRFNVGAHSLFRHRKAHVTPDFVRAAQIGPFQSEERLRSLCAESGTSVIENLRAIHAGLVARWLRAVESGNDQSLIGLSKALHENLRMQAGITRELMPAANVTVNAFMSGDWLADFGRDLMDLVRAHPEIRGDLTNLLKRRMGAQEGQLIDVTPEATRAA